MMNASKLEGVICIDSKAMQSKKKTSTIDNCYQDYYTTTLEPRKDLGSDTTILIRAIDSTVFNYHATPTKNTFLEYLVKVGGLLGFWFCLSSIKISKLLQNQRDMVRSNLYKLPGVSHILKSTMKYSMSTVGTVVLIYLLYILLGEYMEFSTKTIIEVRPLKENDGKVMLSNYPSITICNKHTFNDLLFNEKYQDLFDKAVNTNTEIDDQQANTENTTLNITLNSENDHVKNVLKYILINMAKKMPGENLNKIAEFLVKYMNVSNREELENNLAKIENKPLYGLNGTLEELDFYSQHFSCSIVQDNKYSRICQDIMRTINMVSSMGKCHMYLYWDNYLAHVDPRSYLVEYVKIIKQNLNSKISYLKSKFYIHQAGSIPLSRKFYTSLVMNPMKSYRVLISPYTTFKLPKPYDTNCQSYRYSYTKTDCINQCHQEQYLKHYKCLPNNQDNFVLMFDYDSLDTYRFCSSENHLPKLNMLKFCELRCGDSCQETFYSADVQEIAPSKNTIINNQDEYRFYSTDQVNIIYIPKSYNLQLTYDILCLFILWHGFGLLHWAKRAIKYVVTKVKQSSCNFVICKFFLVICKVRHYFILFAR